MSKPIEELVEIADELYAASAFVHSPVLTEEDDLRLKEIVGPLDDEAWKRLYCVFLIRHMPEQVVEILSS